MTEALLVLLLLAELLQLRWLYRLKKSDDRERSREAWAALRLAQERDAQQEPRP